MVLPDAAMPEPSRNQPELPPTAGKVGPATAAAFAEDAATRCGPLPPPPAITSGPDLLGLLRALRRRWVLALGLGVLLATGAAAAVWGLISGKYTAMAPGQVFPIKPGLGGPAQPQGH